jgi:hypothetical protein
MRRIAPPFLALTLIATVPAFAQEEPPARVGRVAFVQGTLAFHEKGETAWSAAAVNYPVATGGAFWVDPKSRAEIRIGAQSIDMAGGTEIDITQLDQQVMQIAVPQGRVEVHLRQLGEGESAEIDIPRGSVWLLQTGVYDIDAGTADQPSRVAVYEGSARFVGGTVDLAIKPGDVAMLSGNNPVVANVERAAQDEFAQWCRSRDYRADRLAAPYYVSPRMTGYEELDQYGAWRTAADYGEVWFPSSLPADWVPYRDGYWVWAEPWGWNWVDAEPWGFAPFHYGRWAFIDNNWGWVPGGFEANPVYVPALVGFIADPAAILASAVAGATVGWFPLGPGEAYWPGYTNDPSYIRAINTGAVRDPANLGPRPAGDPATADQNFANRRFATVVPQRAFATTQRVGRAALPVSATAVQHAAVTAQAPALQRGGGRAGPAVAGAGGRGTPQPGAAVVGRDATAAAGAVAGARGAGRFAGAAPGRLAAPQRFARAAAPRFAAPRRTVHMAAPRFAAAPRMARMAAPHFAAPHFAGPRFSGGGMPHGGGGIPHLGGGGGGPPHGGGGGGPHGGGGGPHGGVGGGGKGHH